MAEINEQHFQLPRRKNEDIITPREQLIYLAIKYYNNPVNNCYPSLDKISKLVKLSIPTVRKSIQQLVDNGYINIRKEGKRQFYEFNDSKKFEVFSKEFMENTNISPTTKSYLAAMQEFMNRENMKTGNVSWSNREISEKINMPESTISNCNRELVKLDMLTLVQSSVRDKVTGCPKQIKYFNLKEFGQAIAFKFLEVDDRLNQHDSDIANLKEQVKDIINNKDKIIAAQNKEIEAKDKAIETLMQELKRKDELTNPKIIMN